MQVLHLTSELTGGAGLATVRLHRALGESGVESRVCHGTGGAGWPGLVRVPVWSSAPVARWERVADQLTWRRRKAGVPLFSRTHRKGQVDLAPYLDEAEVVHLHWIAKWLDWKSLFARIPPGKPVVVTLHDASFFAGGCHQTNDCRRFEQACGSCPQLKWAHSRDASAAGWKVRQACYAGRRVAVVPVSRWMADHARPAALLKDSDWQEPIHPGIDVRIFRPRDRAACRELLDLAADRFVVCAGSADLGDTNKGIALLLEALKQLPEGLRRNTTLLTYGGGVLPNELNSVAVRQLGYVASEHLLAAVYSAADVYVTPSLMETFGMTAAEAAACGLPVVAFRTGGLAEIVEPGVTGWLLPLGSVEALTRALREAGESSGRREALGLAGRRKAEGEFSILAAATQYGELYRKLLKA